MNARPLPPPAPDPTRKKIRLTEITEKAMRQPFVAKIQSIANASALRTHLNTVMKTRWFRIAGIAVAVFLVILVVLPFLINVNSFRPKIESERQMPWDVGEVGRTEPFNLSRHSWCGGCQHRRRSCLQQVTVHNGEVVGGRASS